MAEKKSFLLRIDREVLDALQKWAADDLRSLNGQMEFLLRDALKGAKRMPKQPAAACAGHGGLTMAFEFRTRRRKRNPLATGIAVGAGIVAASSGVFTNFAGHEAAGCMSVTSAR